MAHETPSVRRNIVANFAGKIAVVAIGLVFPPIYARVLGVESYGLIGVYTSLTIILSLLDLGLSSTFNREMAHLSAESDDSSRRAMHDMVASFGAVYWAVGAAAGALIAAFAPLAWRWIHAEGLPHDTITSSVRLMGLVFALQWPMGAYNGGLLGLQRHAWASAIQVGGTAFRFVGAAFIITHVSRTMTAFFLWQGLGMLLQTAGTWWVLRRTLPAANARGVVRWSVIARNWRFSAGMSIISLLSIALMQADKIVVSGLLPFKQFGYYTLAWTVGNALGQLVQPVFVAVFPRFTQLSKLEQPDEITSLYHSSSQLVSVLVLPAAFVLALFSREVMFGWTGDATQTAATAQIVVVVAIGTALNGLMNVPYALQLGYGWTRLVVVTNAIAVVCVVPLMYVLARRYGAVGAAWAWVVLNASYVVIVIPAMHRRLLRGQMWRWYVMDVGMPLIGAALPAVALRVLLAPAVGRLAAVIAAVGVGVASLAGGALSTSALWRRARALLRPSW